MRSRLTPDALLLGAVLLMTLGIAIFAVDSGRTQEDESLERRTTYSSRPGGYRALFEVMEQLRYPVRRWRRPLDALAEPGTLIVAEPESPPRAGEWLGLADWVRRGNLLIYLSDHGHQLEKLLEHASLPEPPEQSDHPVQPTPPAAAAPDLRTRAGYHLDAGDGAPGAGSPLADPGRRRLGVPDLLAAPSAPLYQDEQGVTVAYTRWGGGAVIQCSSPWSLGTTGIGAGDNLIWLLSTIEAYGPKARVRGRGSGVSSGHSLTPDPRPLTPVLFDEYHHGYEETRGVLSLLAPIARGGLAQLVVAWVLLRYAVSRRFGGRVPDEGRVRRSRSEYLGSMASLLRRARAADLAAAQMRRQFLHEITLALGLPRDAEPGVVITAAGARGVDPERLRALLDRAERLAGDRDHTRPEDALAITRELARLRREITRQP